MSSGGVIWTIEFGYVPHHTAADVIDARMDAYRKRLHSTLLKPLRPFAPTVLKV
jgi:hypothetical protein